MTYNVHYCIASIVFFGLMVIFYARQKKIPTLRSKVYDKLILFVLIALIGDTLSGVLDAYSAVIPIWVLYFVNIFYLLSTQATAFTFLIYCLVLTGVWRQMKRPAQICLAIPYAVVAVCLLATPLCEYGIFYFTDAHLYVRGASHLILYFVAAIYILASAVTVLLSAKKISIKKLHVVMLFIIFQIAAMILQEAFPTLLLNTSASAVAVVAMYYALEMPERHIDPISKVFNRSALPIFVGDLVEQNQNFTLVCFFCHTFDLVEQTIGIDTADKIRVQIGSLIQSRNTKCPVISLDKNNYCMLLPDRVIDREEATYLFSTMPKSIDVGKMQIGLLTDMGVICSDYCDTLKDVYTILNRVTNILENSDGTKLLYADKEFISANLYEQEVEEVLRKALTNDGLKVYYQPINETGKGVVAFEALSRIFDEKLGSIPPDVFIHVAEHNGSIIKLGEMVLDKVCDFAAKSDLFDKGIDHISVNLSIIQLMQPDLAARLKDIIKSHGINPEKINFEITESQLFRSMPTTINNINDLKTCGYKFMLDDFGTGYANFSYLTDLPLSCIKIDKSILWTAMGEKKHYQMLKAIRDIVRALGMDCICEGVENVEQIKVLEKIGINLHQGYFYSPPIPEEEVIPFIEKTNDVSTPS